MNWKKISKQTNNEHAAQEIKKYFNVTILFSIKNRKIMYKKRYLRKKNDLTTVGKKPLQDKSLI